MESVLVRLIVQFLLMILLDQHLIVLQGKIVQTDSGFQESRMPFMYIHLPEQLRLRSTSGDEGKWLNVTELREVFRENSRRLTSQFDVHATLKHLLEGVPTIPGSDTEPYGRSFFTPIPLNRTCEEAGIPDQYCVCSPFMPLTEKHMLTTLANYVISYLNGRLGPYADKCATLSLDVVLKAKMSIELPGGSNLNSTSTSSNRRFFMRIRMMPSKGSVEMILQGMVVKNNRNNTVILDESTLKAVSSVIRLDRYNEQSQCVANTRVESFCYCKSLLKKSGK